MTRMIEIEEHTLEMILDQKEAAEKRCLELEIVANLVSQGPIPPSEGGEEIYRIIRPQWITFVHLCILAGHPHHLDLSPALDLGRSDHRRCRLPQEEVEWLNTRVKGLFGGIKPILTVPVFPNLDLGDMQFSEHGYGEIFTPVLGLDIAIQEVNVLLAPPDPRWPRSLKAVWGTMSAYDCLSSTFSSPNAHHHNFDLNQGISPCPMSHIENITNYAHSTPSYPMGRYELYTMPGACPY